MCEPRVMARVDNDTDDSDDGDRDVDGYDNGTHTSLDLVNDSLKINCNIKSSYTTWEPREAFRELVQNWRDGIIKSFKLAETDFRVKPKQEKTSGRITEVVYTAGTVDEAGNEKCLGYIRYKGRDGEGTVDVVNCNATLQPKHLVQGATSKAGRADQAGAFGEGLKVALVVLMRGDQNHHVQCRSGGFSWTFNFDRHGILVARLRRMSGARIYRENEQAERQARRLQSLLPFVAQPETDVHFIIGDRRRGMSDRGEPTKRNFVSRTEFDAWTKAALFLQNEPNDLNDAGDASGAVITTRYGDLLTGPQFRGMIYLKGLLLDESTPARSASRTSLPLRFGYNFASGRTDRDRNSVSSADDESRAILAIWDAVLAIRPDMVTELSDMLNSTVPEYADVIFARRYTTTRLAILLKQYLVGGDRAANWYYSSTEKNQNPRLDHIIGGLGRNGVELTKTYWDILSRHGLLHTAEEEELARFKAAPRAAVPRTEFPRQLCRLLRACLRACPQTATMYFDFVQAGHLGLQLAFSDDDSSFRIHDRWLSIEGAAAELCLHDTLTDAGILYQSVRNLFADALDQLPLESFVGRDGDSNASLPPGRRKRLENSLAEQRLNNYLRTANATVEVVTGRPDLRVKWPGDPYLPTGTEIEIQCHRATTCAHFRSFVQIAYDVDARLQCLVAPNTGDDAGGHSHNKPNCRVARLRSSIGEHLVTDLKWGESYFFLLVMTPSDPGSFVSFSRNDYRCSDWTDPFQFTRPRHSPPLAAGTGIAGIAGPSQSSQHHNVAPTANMDINNSNDSNVSNDNNDNYENHDNTTGEVRDVIVVGEAGGGPLRPLANATTTAGGQYDVGPKLSELDVLSISHWHAAESFGNVVNNVVIGIKRENVENMADIPEMSETRKRQRME